MLRPLQTLSRGQVGRHEGSGFRWTPARFIASRSFQSYCRACGQHLETQSINRSRLSGRNSLQLWGHGRTIPAQAQQSVSRRAASTAADAVAATSNRLRNGIIGTLIVGITGYGYFYLTDTRASIHKYVVVPTIRALFPDAEAAHEAGIVGLGTLYKAGMNPRERATEDADGMLSVEVFGHTLSNPVGVSAGLDKNGAIVSPLFDLGPSIVEIGGITPLPQEGNPKPRVWRVLSQEAMINRYGLNSKGAAHVSRELKKRIRHFAERHGYGIGQTGEDYVLNGEAGVPPGSLVSGKLLAVQIAKNKSTPETDTDAVARDYVACVEQLGRYADILVVNVSSPNTPGLRTLQKSEPLEKILSSVVAAAQTIDRRTKPFVMVKVSPDESSDDDISGICDAVWASNVDGVIVANTTRGRPLSAPHLLTASEASVLHEQGGYSGPALLENTVSLVRRYRRALDAPFHEPKPSKDSNAEGDASAASDKHQQQDQQPKTIFASGGITCGDDVLRVCNAGASVAMAYTALSYKGAGFFTECKREMRQRIREAVRASSETKP